MRRVLVGILVFSLLLGIGAGFTHAAEKAAQAPDVEASAVSEALKALKAHIMGETPLEPEAIESNRKTINAGAVLIGENEDLIKASFDLVQTYEEKLGPLWIKYKGLNNRKRTAGDEIHWAAFWVMQHIVDHVYTTENLRTRPELLADFRFQAADYFPGKVEETVNPEETHTVKIMASYQKTWGPPIFMADRPARKPTGAYVVPGTIATVTVPEALVGKGYQIRVGAHSWDLQKKPRVTRLFRVTTLYDIDKTEMQVANPLGGAIYIEVPYEADAGVVEVSITGAVRSPYFSWKPFHKTTLEEWRKTERAFKAPWADFQSEKFMMQVPTSWIYQFDDPVSLMQNWDKAIDAANDLMGRPHLFGRETLYTQVDTQLRGRAFHPGYPAGNRGYDPTKDYGGNHNNLLLRSPEFAHSYVFHEMGHGFLFPKYPGDREAAVNIPHAAMLNMAFGVDLMEAFRSSRSVQNEFRTLETEAIAWMMSDHFVAEKGMQGYERQYQLKGHAKFIDIVRLYGWDVLGKFFRSINQDYEDGNEWPRNVSDTDLYTLRLSEQAGVDLRPLIHFWGIYTQNNEKSDADMKAKDLKPSRKIYDLLVNYKSLIPKDNAAFREFALKYWGKEPSPKGYTTERNHAARWESYDQEEAKRVTAVMQKIIDRYFPNGAPEEEEEPEA